MTEPNKFEEHRQGFLMHYYDMAVKDLDRHLSTGWQSMTVIAGGIVSLSLGHKGDLPFPIAVSAALAVFAWGWAHILDANYWAIRAIAFLANVEAIYFAEEDRSAINPYIGRHPPAKLMDSLRHQCLLVSLFAGVALIDYVLQLSTAIASPSGSLHSNASVETRVEWFLPAIVIGFGVLYAIRSWRERLRDYESFMKTSPGPGLVPHRSDLEKRGVLLRPGAPVSLDQPVVQALRARLSFVSKLFLVVSVVVLFAVLAAALVIFCGTTQSTK